jgi:hypothetical protein
MPEFGHEVRKALGEMRYRQVAQKVGVSATYIGDMVSGRVPSRPVVVKFAEACDLKPKEANRLLAIAGYAPIPDTENESPAEYFWRRLSELRARYGRAEVMFSLNEGSDALTFEHADATLRMIEEHWKAQEAIKEH